MGTLTVEQRQALRRGLLAAFDGTEDLEQILYFHFEKAKYSVVSGQSNFGNGVMDVIQWAEKNEWERALVLAARSENPNNVELKAASEALGLTARPFENSLVPEAVLLEKAGLTKTGEWLKRYLEAELRTFRIEFHDEGFGTGFLVGENLALTSDHVFADNELYSDAVRRSHVKLRFDYRVAPDGTAAQGTAFSIDGSGDWLVKRSPSPNLDYALFRINGTPGTDQTGLTAKSPTRGWLKLADRTPSKGEPLIVMQHPNGRRMEVAIGYVDELPARAEGAAPVVPVAGKFWHRANTEGASSGAPCFDGKWNLVGIHQGSSAQHELNRAISIEAVAKDLAQAGHSVE